MATQVISACPHCGQSYSVSTKMSGRSVQCKKCGQTFSITPDSSEQTASKSAPDVVAAKKSVPPPPPPPKPEATAVIGSYQIRKTLGQGSFGIVYLGYHPFLEKEVAIKVLKAEALKSSNAIDRFLREAKLLARMKHKNVLQVYDANKHGNDYYFACDYIAGNDLGDIIPEKGLEPVRAIRLMIQMLQGLGYAHEQGIVHRDVKPANARIDAQDNLYVMDFGLAGWASQTEAAPEGKQQARLTRAGTVLGSPAYMSPEQVAGQTDAIGPAADLYSAGVVLYELLTGQMPFDAPSLPALYYAIAHSKPESPSTHRPDIDPELAQICLKALSKQPSDRYLSAAAFVAALEAWLARQTQPTGTQAKTATHKTLEKTATTVEAAAKLAKETVSATAQGKSSTMVATVLPVQEVQRTPPKPTNYRLLAGMIVGGAVLLVALVLGLAILAKGSSGKGYFEQRKEFKH